MNAPIEEFLKARQTGLGGSDIAKLVLARRRGERIEAEKLLHGICFTVAEKVEARARKDAEAGL